MDLSHWIERNAGFMPEKPALVFEGEEISYASFRDLVRRHARTLKHQLHVGRGDRVAFLGLNTPDFLAVMFACARLGAMFAPLNWRLAPPEHVYILGDSAAKVLIADADYRDHAEGIRDQLTDCELVSSGFEADGWFSLDRDAAADDLEDANPHVGEDTPLLLVYTSGTTGRPKGAVLTQRALLVNALNSLHMHEMGSDDVVLTALPMFHVGGLNIQTTPAFYCGATVVLQRRFDPGAMLPAIPAHRVTLAVLVPAVMDALQRHPAWDETDLSSLKSATTGSSIVPMPFIDKFHERGVPVIQIYGSTETAPVAVYQRRADGLRKPGSTGRAGLHCEVRIVDDDGNDLPVGQSGEILIRGGQNFMEYWGNAEATAEALRDGWFHTGDVGYVDEEGDYWVNDRKKDVIISGGENIYPAELEAVLHEMPDLTEAAVVGRADARWGEVPVAVLVAAEDASLSREEIIGRFEGVLARFKHPKDVIFVEQLPRNVMGKVLKYELRAALADGTLEAIDL